MSAPRCHVQEVKEKMWTEVRGVWVTGCQPPRRMSFPGVEARRQKVGRPRWPSSGMGGRRSQV